MWKSEKSSRSNSRGFGILIIGYLDINMNSSKQIIKFLEMRVSATEVAYWILEIRNYASCFTTFIEHNI